MSLFPHPLNGHPSFPFRELTHEDENISAAKKIKRQNRHAKTFHIIKSCLKFTNPGAGLPSNTVAPQVRDFPWMISSYYVPEEYQDESIREQTPWVVELRCMLIDLTRQLERGIGTSWRDHQVKDQSANEKEFLSRTPANYKRCFPSLRWGRRIVFSERAGEEPRYLTGNWLVVAYLWSDSREWLRNANVGNLISFNNVLW